MEHLGQFIINHWQLCLALLAVLGLIFVNELLAQKGRAHELSTTAAVAFINHNDAVIIDLRNAELYQAGHIINSMRAAIDDFNQKRMDKYKNKALLLVCARGVESIALSTKLKQQGFTNVNILAGGITAWQTANLPLVKGKK